MSTMEGVSTGRILSTESITGKPPTMLCVGQGLGNGVGGGPIIVGLRPVPSFPSPTLAAIGCGAMTEVLLGATLSKKLITVSPSKMPRVG